MPDAIPFEFASRTPLVIVEARLGPKAKKAEVVVDTGAVAPFTLFLGERMASRLKLKLSAPMTPAVSTAVGPERQSYRAGTLDRLTLGPVTLGPIEVAVLPMIDAMSGALGHRFDAIIGQDFLKGRTWSIDYGRQVFDLNAAPGEAGAATAFRYPAGKPLILVTVTVGGATLTMEVDTGASGTTISPEAAARAGIVADRAGTMVGAGGAVGVGVAAARVSFGGVTRDLGHVSVSEEMTTISRGAGVQIDGILGTDFLAGTRLTVDEPRRLLWLGLSGG